MTECSVDDDPAGSRRRCQQRTPKLESCIPGGPGVGSPNWIRTVPYAAGRSRCMAAGSALTGSLSALCYIGGNRSPIMKTDFTAGEKFQKLVELMARLRAPDGCPWDREQTFESIKPYTLEETYEVLDAIDRREWKDLAEELGDFLLQAVFYAQMGSEQGLFGIEDALDAINEKLIRRHPHVFGEESAESAGDVKRIWAGVKAAEKKEQGREEGGLLGSVPRALPALVEAQQIASRAAAGGVDGEASEEGT